MNQIDRHGGDPLAIRGALATKEVPTSQRRTIFRHVGRAIETMRQNYRPRLVVDVCQDNVRVWLEGRLRRCGGIIDRAWSGRISRLFWRGNTDARIGSRDRSEYEMRIWDTRGDVRNRKLKHQVGDGVDGSDGEL